MYAYVRRYRSERACHISLLVYSKLPAIDLSVPSSSQVEGIKTGGCAMTSRLYVPKSRRMHRKSFPVASIVELLMLGGELQCLFAG